jgi:hypothetical protein
MSKQTFEQKMKNLTGLEVQESNVKDNNKKICYIIGTANSRMKAPFDTTNPNAQFWGVGHCLLLQDIRRLDKVFEIHLPYIYNQEISPFSQKPIVWHANKEYALFGRTNDVAVITQKKDPNINIVDVFDRDYYKDKYFPLFPPSDVFYATNSIAWMILKAIDDGFEEIHLYGIHLETQSEWTYERPCNEMWLGFFMGMMYERGIKTPVIYLPEEADVMRGYHEYGFADIEVRRKKIQSKIEMDNKIIEDMKTQRQNIVNELNRLHSEINFPLDKKIEHFKEQINIFTKELEIINSQNQEDYKKTIENKITDLIKTNQENLKNIDARLNAFMGAKDRTEYFLNELNA